MIQAGYDLIKKFEGLYLKQYFCPAGVSTIGWGTTTWWKGEAIPLGATVALEEAQKLLERDLAFFELRVQGLLLKAPRTAPESFAALVSFAYNVGAGALAGSTLLRRIKAGDWDGAADQFLRWTMVGGRPLLGLLLRRKAERKLFMEGVVANWQEELGAA